MGEKQGELHYHLQSKKKRLDEPTRLAAVMTSHLAASSSRGPSENTFSNSSESSISVLDPDITREWVVL